MTRHSSRCCQVDAVPKVVDGADVYHCTHCGNPCETFETPPPFTPILDAARVQKIAFYNNEKQAELHRAYHERRAADARKLLREMGTQYMTDVPYLLYFVQSLLRLVDSDFKPFPPKDE